MVPRELVIAEHIDELRALLQQPFNLGHREHLRGHAPNLRASVFPDPAGGGQGGGQRARIRLFFGRCSSSASPIASMTGGTYIPKRPRKPFFSPYPPPTGFLGERAHASTLPSAAGFCSSALPSGIQSPCCFSILCRSSSPRN